jgi:hypothetical protein
MKKIIPFFILLTFCCKLASAQFTNKYWHVGRHTALNFNTTPPTIILNDSNKYNTLLTSNTSICDRNGNTIFYTNAMRVFNKNGHVMPNGSGIDSGTYSTSYAASGSFNPLWKGATVVPFPNDTNKFYVFYLNMEWDVDGGYSPEKLYYLVVDRTLDNGLGDVTIKEQTVLSGDTLDNSSLVAMKHGNGKDWWLIVRKYKSSKYYKILIDSAGVHTQPTQTIGNGFNYNLSFSGVGNVSLQGDKICYLFDNLSYQPFQMDLFDFDRCTGALSNYKTIYHANTTDTIIWWSSCFSPGGRFLYFNDKAFIYQMDLNSANLLNSVIKVGTNLAGYAAFFKMEIAPDNKIYVCPYGGYEFMSVINKPDSFGLACNFVENAIQFGSHTLGPWADGSLPNNPNYSLGKLNCDVGIQATAENKSELLIYPNPSKDKLLVSSNQFKVNTIEVTDLLGQIVLAVAPSPLVVNPDAIGERAGVRSINIENLPSGIYFIRAIDEKGFQQVSKFVKE